MENCVFTTKRKKLPNGTKAEIVVGIKVNNFVLEDQKEVFDFFEDFTSSFYTVKIPAIAGEVTAVKGENRP